MGVLSDRWAMERILKYEILKEDNGRTIKDFLQGKGFSGQNIVELKKMKESILLNGVWEYVTYRVKEGDVLCIHIREEESSEKIPPVELPFPVVYEDEDIVVVNKPADMPIHPSLNNYENTLGNAAAYYFAKQNKAFIFRCINRLDRDTTGLTILAKHMVSAGILQSQMVERKIKREYLAIVDGIMEEDEGTIDAPIGRKDGSTIERMVDYENGERAVTHYRVLGRKKAPLQDIRREEQTIATDAGSSTLVALKLETGRTHQIRVHMTHIGHPLLGDFLYNPSDDRMSRQALHAWHLSFTHPITGEEMIFKAPIPEDMLEYWNYEGGRKELEVKEIEQKVRLNQYGSKEIL